MTSNGARPPSCDRCDNRILRAYLQALADSMRHRRPVGLFIYISPGAPTKVFRTIPAGLISEEVDRPE